MSKKTLQHLINVRGLFTTKKWQPSLMAVDTNGAFVSPHHKNAVAFSLYGAMRRVGVQSPVDKGKVMKALNQHLSVLDWYSQLKENLVQGDDYLGIWFTAEKHPLMAQANLTHLLDCAIHNMANRGSKANQSTQSDSFPQTV